MGRHTVERQKQKRKNGNVLDATIPATFRVGGFTVAHHGRSNDILELFVVADSFQCVAKDVSVAVRSKQF